MKKLYTILIVVLAFSGVLINILSSTLEEPVNIIRGIWLIRYFTLQSNIIVGFYFMYLLGKRNKKLDRYIGGVTVYISITFIVFAIMLSGTWNPTGWNQVANILSHYLVPILVIIYFFTFNDTSGFTYEDIIKWMYYPMGYVLFMLTHGWITNDYLYPFFQVSEIGIIGLIITIISLVLFFVLLSFIFMKIVSLKEKYNQE